MAVLQLEAVWREMVWELLENTQLIGFSSEQKLNSLTWPLNSLAGAPQTHLFLGGLESANCSADRKESQEPAFRAASCQQRHASFLLFVATFSPLAGGACEHPSSPGQSAFMGSSLPSAPQEGSVSSGLASSLPRQISHPPKVFPGWVYMEYFTIL